MVFASHGRVMSEAEIRTMCDCTPLGTEALKAVDAARAFAACNVRKRLGDAAQPGHSRARIATMDGEEVQTALAPLVSTRLALSVPRRPARGATAP
jgi:hypothetical protein